MFVRVHFLFNDAFKMFNKLFLKFGDNQFYNAIKITFTAIVAFLFFTVLPILLLLLLLL